MSGHRAAYKLISCSVFQRELCAAIAVSPNVVDPEFLELGLHERPASLRARLQERIDAAGAASDGPRYEAILLGYGLCGNALAGIEARGLPLVLARAHDCCTILLGSRSAFLAQFGECLSASWSSAGYIERGSTYFRTSELGRAIGHGLEYDELVASYGEDNANYIYETLHPSLEEKELFYIETPETEGLGYAEAMRARAAAEGRDFVLLRGSTRLLRALLAGNWEDEDFLVVPPGRRIAALYDHERVLALE
ncbi:MAG TPA: DUF1638 domain-containing protein [Rectinemataceae bacterium]|nr:DUF1638 domain-containing protein [Rectinemataceae bacterium]